MADSVAKTVSFKEGNIQGACLEIAVIVNDCKCKAVGALRQKVRYGKHFCIHSLLHGAGTWVEIDTAKIRRLNTLQN